MIATVVISDRGDLYLPGCHKSIVDHVRGDHVRIDVDDSRHVLGLAGAVRQGWQLAVDAGADYVFHVEEDFRFLDEIRLDDLVHVLDRAPHLAQIVLKRQPWNDTEQAAGGIIEADPGGYLECRALGRNVAWCEHERIFSLNPCLIPRKIVELGWPDGNEAEFTRTCLDAGYRFAFYGGKLDPPRVEHVGHERAAGWKL